MPAAAGPTSAAPAPDPVFRAVDGLVREGTLDHGQADRVYAVMLRLPVAREPTAARRAEDGAPAAAAGRLVERAVAAVALLGSAVVLGSSLLAGIVAAQYEEGFDWEPFLVVSGVAVTLAALVAGVSVLARDPAHGRWVTAGPAALAAVALGLVVVVGLLEEDAVDYVTGGVILLSGAGLYALLRTSPPLLAAVLGGLVVVISVIDDASSDAAGDGNGLGIAIGLFLYGLVVAGAGWLLPTRHVTAPVGGALAVAGSVVAAYVSLVVGALSGLGGEPVSDTTGDVATALALGLLACLGLFALHALTGLARYGVTATLGTVSVLSVCIPALELDNTLRWTAGVAVLGAALALGAGWIAIRGIPFRR